MKVVIKFSKKYKKPEDIVGVLQKDNFNQRMLDIINNKNVKGFKVVDYKDRVQYTIIFK